MKLKEKIKRIFGIYEFDREAEMLIKKSINLYHKGGRVNKWRSIRMHNKIRKNFNCYVYPSIQVGENFYIAHSIGIAIGKTTVIGNNCKIYPNAMIVANLIGDKERYMNKERTHAKIGDNCVIGAGAIIIGPVEIGDNVFVASGAIITKDIPSNCFVKNVNEITEKLF